MSNTIKVTVTGAAGNIGYALVPLIAQGDMFGPKQDLCLTLLEVAPVLPKAEAVAMEIQDCAFPLVKEIICTSDSKEAFTDVDYVIFVGAFPRRDGMERKDLIEKNASIFSEQGKILDEVAKKSVKVLVVGNPANTNCLITAKCAPSIPRENFSCLTRLDHNRALYQVAHKAGVNVGEVTNVTIWGNHSGTQFPDLSSALINGSNAAEIINDTEWVKGEFISTVQQRGAMVIKQRGLSSAFSAAKAIVDHMHDWVNGTKEGQHVSMGIFADGHYGIDDEIIYSFPVTIKDGKFEVVQDIKIDEFAREKMNATRDELKEEAEIAFQIVGL